MGANSPAYAVRESFDATTIADQFMRSLDAANHQTSPYDYWLLENALDRKLVESIAHLPFTPPQEMDFGGRRECNNKLRLYFTPEFQRQVPSWKAIADAFRDPRLIRRIEQVTKADLTGGHLRIEYCQDTDGFWLEPHVDISVKLFSMSIYLGDEPELADAGTDIYDDSPQHKRVTTSPYGMGKGMIFIPSANTWHGFSKRPIRGIRKSLIINYVTSDFRAVEELA